MTKELHNKICQALEERGYMLYANPRGKKKEWTEFKCGKGQAPLTKMMPPIHRMLVRMNGELRLTWSYRLGLEDSLRDSIVASNEFVTDLVGEKAT